jgi:hypothetical protein
MPLNVANVRHYPKERKKALDRCRQETKIGEQAVRPIQSTNCTADEAATLMRNAWKYVHVGNSHVRIHPPDSYVSVIPQGPVQYIAIVELLQEADCTWGTAEQDCHGIVTSLFPDIK